MFARDLMQENPQTVYTSDSINTVIKLLAAYHLEAIPVIEKSNKLCGIITSTDILKMLSEHYQIPHITVEKIMTKNVIFVHLEDSLKEIYNINFQYIPVVDKTNQLKGLLSRNTVLSLSYKYMRSAKNALKQIAEISYNGVIIMDEHKIIRQINEPALSLLKITKEDAINHLADDLHFDNGLSEIMRSGDAQIDISLQINGQIFIVSRAPIWSGFRIVGAVMTIKNDSEKEKALSAQIEQQKAELDHFNCIFESICQGIIAVGMDQQIRYANHAYEDIMGIAHDDLIGHDVQNAVENSRVPVVLRTGIPEFGAIQTVNGRQVIVNRLPIFKDGKIVGAVGQAVFKNIEEVERLLERNRQALIANKHHKIHNPFGIATFENIIGRSVPLLHAKQLAAKVAITDTTVLIQGESGTGKDLFAQAIHSASNRNNAKFIAVNCAAIPAELLESELFGYDEGAFTGAKRGGKRGKFELAEGGTLFLDEIGDMPSPMQAKLLRVIQNKTFEHVGGEKSYTCNVRIITATNHDLQKLVTDGKFREDLYYRLHVVCIQVPALRERSEDIDELIENLMPDICTKAKVPFKKFSPEAVAILRKCLWPGNIRELINFLEQISATIDSALILPKHLPKELLSEYKIDTSKNIDTQIEDERIRITEAIKTASGNKSLAAKLLGIHRSTLYIKIKKYNLKKVF